MKNKNIILLGGTGTLGNQVLDELNQKNFNIIFSSSSQKKINLIKLKKNSENIIQGLTCDTSNEKSIKLFVNRAFKKL